MFWYLSGHHSFIKDTPLSLTAHEWSSWTRGGGTHGLAAFFFSAWQTLREETPLAPFYR